MAEVLINTEELEFLRERIILTYQEKEQRSLTTNSSLKNYEHLRDHFQSEVTEGSHISTNLLRKLFYDTRSKESTVFRKSFLDTCYLYITDNRYTRDQYRISNGKGEVKSINKKVVVGLFFVTVIAIVIIIFQLNQEDLIAFEEHFDNLTPEYLEENGWTILDEDPDFWGIQTKDGYLTLTTKAGDYWVKPKEERKIKNLLVKRVDCESCMIEIKIDSFYPYQIHQQTGLILLSDTSDRDDFIRYTYIKRNDSIIDPPAIGIQYIQMQNGYVDEIFGKNLLKGLNSNTLHLEINNGISTLKVREGPEWSYLSTLKKYGIDVEVNYIGIASFHGWTKDDGTYFAADTIPAYIDYVKVSPL